MKRKVFLVLLAVCLGLSACQAQHAPGGNSPTDADKIKDPSAASDSGAPVQNTETTKAQESDAPTAESTQPETDPVLPRILEGEGMGFNGLDNGLIAYLRANGMEDKSFTVSPLSLKAALALTAVGAEGETQRQLLDALGFKTVEELTDWYASVLVGVADFDGRIYGADKEDSAYRVVNAIFHNGNCDGEFRDSYKELVAQKLAAQASSYPALEITGAINRWVKDQTDGMIPSIVQDASQSAAVLVNALYLKTKWIEPFAEADLRDFTTVDGQTVQKEFITRTDNFRYYEDSDCQMVVISMQGGTQIGLLLGDGTNLNEKLQSAKTRRVRVTLPKFEVETSLDKKELVKYLIASGCGLPFVDGGAEFDPMFTKELFVDDIIQKAKVHVDEKGLEAAAATAVIMTRATAVPRPEEPVDFTADRPFQFVIFREDAAPELLFWGQVMD